MYAIFVSKNLIFYSFLYVCVKTLHILFNLYVFIYADEPTVQYMTGDQVPFLPSSSQPDAVFTCNATGTPNLAVRWKHNNKEIISSDNKYSIAEVRTAGMSSVLTIKGVRLTDSGNVTCDASVSYINDRGNDSHTNAMRTISETLSRKLVVLGKNPWESPGLISIRGT